MAKKTEPAEFPFPTSIQTVERLGLKPGDIIASRFPGWQNILFRLKSVEAGHVWVDRLNRGKTGAWRVAFSHKMVYFPPDVKRVVTA